MAFSLSSSFPSQISLDIDELGSVTADDVFSRLMGAATGGTRVLSQAAPALATQFVKSPENVKAGVGVKGSFAEIIYPSADELKAKYDMKHSKSDMFGYYSTYASDLMPAGYGERSARALQREESTYQLKGTFPTAALAFSKLRARVEAREGDVQAVSNIFAKMWNLPTDQVDAIPQLHMTGSEVTRMSAMEDRAYHALSSHPTNGGGYRVDTASIAQDAIGETTPLNWPRLRTALKGIASVQLHADPDISAYLRALTEKQEFRFCMGIVIASQPVYTRSYAWETVVERIMMQSHLSQRDQDDIQRMSDIRFAMTSALGDSKLVHLLTHPVHQIGPQIRSIANRVSKMSNEAIERTIDVIAAHDRDRAELVELDEEGLLSENTGQMLKIFDAPRYKVVRTSLYRGTKFEVLGSDRLPDVASHGRPKLMLDMAEIRESKLALPLEVRGALNVAVHMLVMREDIRPHAYELMVLLHDAIDHDDDRAPLSVQLRKQHLYDNPRIRALGPKLFGSTFIGILDLLFRNMTAQSLVFGAGLKTELWAYVSSRTLPKRQCPVLGDWRDVIQYLHAAPEGWTLYFWARKTIGRQHHAVCTGILAPIASGTYMDSLSLCKLGIKERANRWRDYYNARYKEICDRVQLEVASRKDREEYQRHQDRYVPPMFRTVADLDEKYDMSTYDTRKQGIDPKVYENIVEMQSKAKFFANIEVFTIDRRIIAGLTDDALTKIWVEIYQSRWYSLHSRIKKANERNQVFKLGDTVFHEHPWGSLNEKLPTTVGGLMLFLNSLDTRAWTIQPSYLQDKFRKSLHEMWDDISREIAELREYALAVHERDVEAQEDAMMLHTARMSVNMLPDSSAVELPTVGYRAPWTMPQRSITIEKNDVPMEMQTDANTMVRAPELDNDLDQLEDFDCGAEFEMSGGAEFELAEFEEAQCISLREIWHILGLEEVSDDRMRHALGLPRGYNLEAQHNDAQYGPTFLVGEEGKVARAWASRKPAIMYRLDRSNTLVLEDDM